MNDQEFREASKKAFVTDTSLIIPNKHIRACWAENENKRAALYEQMDLLQEINVLRLSFLLGDITRQQFVEQSKSMREKVKMLDPIVNAKKQ